MIKKILGLIAIVAMLSLPIMTQEDDIPISVDLHAYVAAGMAMTLTPGVATWSLIPLPTVVGEQGQFILSDEGTQALYFSYRLSAGSINLICTSDDVLYENDPTKRLAPEIMLSHKFSGGVAFESLLPPVLTEQVIHTDTMKRGYVEASLEISFLNSDHLFENGIQAGNYYSTITYTLINVVS